MEEEFERYRTLEQYKKVLFTSEREFGKMDISVMTFQNVQSLLLILGLLGLNILKDIHI